MLGIESWQDLSAVITILVAVVAVITWLVRLTVLKPLRHDIEDLKKYVDNQTAELRADHGETMRDRVVRIDTTTTSLRKRVERVEAALHRS